MGGGTPTQTETGGVCTSRKNLRTVFAYIPAEEVEREAPTQALGGAKKINFASEVIKNTGAAGRIFFYLIVDFEAKICNLSLCPEPYQN